MLMKTMKLLTVIKYYNINKAYNIFFLVRKILVYIITDVIILHG